MANRCTMFLRGFLIVLCVVLCVQRSYAQSPCSFQDAYMEFGTLKEQFLAHSTESMWNELIDRKLRELQSKMSEVRVSSQERDMLMNLRKDIDVFIEFLAPIAGEYNAHLSGQNMKRLCTLFGSDFHIAKLDVSCKKDEVEFVEVRLGNLIMCYFHCITDVAESGLRIKFKAKSGNICSSGEYGAMKGEYVPILNNVGNRYLQVKSAIITKRF